MKRSLFVGICFFMLFTGCRKKSEPKPPEAVQLISPEQNSECTTGVSLGQDTSRVTFNWSAANNTETYELRVTNINTGLVQNIVSSSTSAALILSKGQAYSWFVRSRNSNVDRTVSSAVWNFYNSGSRTTFAPFPATIISPASSETVFMDINNEVTLSWTAADLDNDIVNYEVYFSAQSIPTDLIRTLTPSTSSIKVTVIANTIYYWSIVVIDLEGNRTSSGVYNFKVL